MWRNPRIRGETAWVLGSKLVDFTLSFLLLKMLTNYLSEDHYAVFALATTAVLLLTHIGIMPMKQAYLRYFHTASDRGEARCAGLSLLRWYAVVTFVVILASFTLAAPLSALLRVPLYTVPCVGILFLGQSWRYLAIEVLNIRRQRAACALYSSTCLSSQLLAVLFIVHFTLPTAQSVLLTYALIALVFAGLTVPPVIRRILASPATASTRLAPLILRFGTPYALLAVFQWLQQFTDRYILGMLLDLDSVGVYVAAYQVCGVPFLLGVSVVYTTILPVAYRRASDIADPSQLWAADKLLLLGIAAYCVFSMFAILAYLFFGHTALVLLTSERFALPSGLLALIAVARFTHGLVHLLIMFYAIHQRILSCVLLFAVTAIIAVPLSYYAVTHLRTSGAVLSNLLTAASTALLLILGPTGSLWLIRASRRRLRIQQSMALVPAPLTRTP